MVGLPININDLNLKAASGKSPAFSKLVSKSSAVSTAEVEPKAHSEKASVIHRATIDFAEIRHAIGGDRRIGRDDRAVRD